MHPEINFIRFHNTSLGELVFTQVVGEVVKFMKEVPAARYRVMIGSDSNGAGLLDLVSVVAIHRVGNGGRYFWCRQVKKNIQTLRQKIYAEVEASLNLAALFLGFRLPKGQKTTNWARAELTPSQITYAATDAWVWATWPRGSRGL